MIPIHPAWRLGGWAVLLCSIVIYCAAQTAWPVALCYVIGAYIVLSGLWFIVTHVLHGGRGSVSAWSPLANQRLLLRLRNGRLVVCHQVKAAHRLAGFVLINYQTILNARSGIMVIELAGLTRVQRNQLIWIIK